MSDDRITRVTIYRQLCDMIHDLKILLGPDAKRHVIISHFRNAKEALEDSILRHYEECLDRIDEDM